MTLEPWRKGTLKKARKPNTAMISIESTSKGLREKGNKDITVDIGQLWDSKMSSILLKKLGESRRGQNPSGITRVTSVTNSTTAYGIS